MEASLTQRKNISRVRGRLLRWYTAHKRDLPWRRTADPYAIWVAETMLQQTQVHTVLPYYERFTKMLPTLATLNRAPLGKVLTLWSGLGYYRRAENLKKAAKLISQNYGGKIPESYEVLRSLPGIGEYTAGAVMSIAFGKPFPAIDGNARRVISRVFNTQTEPKIRKISLRLVAGSRPGDFNQALMELGATVCLPRTPECGACPLASNCAAMSAISDRVAVKKSRMRTRKVHWPLALIRRDGQILLRRRPGSGILAGLWELPGGEMTKHESSIKALHRHLRRLNGTAKLARKIGSFRHSITNRRITAPVFLIPTLATPALPNSEWRWFRLSVLERYPLSAMTRKAIAVLQAYEKSSV